MQDSVEVVSDMSGVVVMDIRKDGKIEYEEKSARCLKRAAVRKVLEQELREIQARVDELVILLEQL
jgi:hypothetical protein